MRVLVTGGTGGVGRALTARLLERGDEVLVLSRDAARARGQLDPRVQLIQGDPCRQGPWQQVVATCDGVVHLAAHSVWEGRWREPEKARIRASRIEATTLVAEAVAAARGRTSLVSASAVGQYYGKHGDEHLGEDAEPAETFIATVCADWERSCAPALAAGARVSQARIGVVLSSALQKVAGPFRWFVGGAPGSGEQWVPWVDPRDLADMLIFALERSDVVGPFNAVAPEPVRMREFAAAVGRVLQRPVWVPIPEFAVRWALGEVACLIVGGARAQPVKLQSLGFRHTHAELDLALRDVLAAS